MTIDLTQGSPEWRQARAGSLGASQVSDALATIRTGKWAGSRDTIMGTLISERLTGSPVDTYTNTAMQWGLDTEPEARIAYEFEFDVTVQEVGIVRHPNILHTHASPDGVIGEGLIEIKAPNTATHIATLLGKNLALKYLTQMQWQMACTGAVWCDFVSFDPRMPDEMRMFVQRIQRDEETIKHLEDGVALFLDELEKKLENLTQKYPPPPVNVISAL